MDRCCDVSTRCTSFKLIKAECLVFLGRYQEAQEIAKYIYVFLLFHKFKIIFYILY